MEKKESKAVETTAPHPNKIGIKEGIGYMLGDAGNLFVLTYVSSFLKVFYTDVLKIATDKVATLFLVSRLWDAVNDPMWGTIVAKRRPNKDGKYRSYLKWLAIPLALSQLVCFIDVRAITNKQWALLLFAYALYRNECSVWLSCVCYNRRSRRQNPSFDLPLNRRRNRRSGSASFGSVYYLYQGQKSRRIYI